MSCQHRQLLLLEKGKYYEGDIKRVERRVDYNKW